MSYTSRLETAYLERQIPETDGSVPKGASYYVAAPTISLAIEDRHIINQAPGRRPFQRHANPRQRLQSSFVVDGSFGGVRSYNGGHRFTSLRTAYRQGNFIL